MDIEEALKFVGEYGRVQKEVFWSMAIPQMFIAWDHMLNVFVSATPQFVCNTDDATIVGCSPNPSRTPCKSYTFNTSDFTSTASEWNLVCSSAYKTDMTQSLYMVGLLMGNLVGGYFADNHGRKLVCCVGAIGVFFFGVLAATAGSFGYYLLGRYVTGLLSGSFGLVSFTLPAEVVGSSYRGYVNVVTSITFALGISTLPILAFFIRDWRALSLVCALPGLLGISFFFFLPESPRWLLSQGRIGEAETTLMKMWVRNRSCSHPCRPIRSQAISSFSPPKRISNSDSPTDECFSHDCVATGPPLATTVSNDPHHHHQDHASQNDLHLLIQQSTTPPRITLKVPHKRDGRASMKDLLCNVRLLVITLINIFSWFVGNMTYYGLNFKMGDLNGNRYLNVALSGLVEIPACILTLYFMDRSGRKITFTVTLFASAVVCLSITILPPVASGLSTFIALLGKTAISTSVCVCWMHAAEMYPTNIRNKAVSLCSMFGRLGGVVAPMVLAMGRIYPRTDFLVFGVLALVAGVASNKLPETLNRSLPETLDDLERSLHSNIALKVDGVLDENKSENVPI